MVPARGPRSTATLPLPLDMLTHTTCCAQPWPSLPGAFDHLICRGVTDILQALPAVPSGRSPSSGRIQRKRIRIGHCGRVPRRRPRTPMVQTRKLQQGVGLYSSLRTDVRHGAGGQFSPRHDQRHCACLEEPIRKPSCTAQSRSRPHTATSRTRNDGTPHRPRANLSARFCSAVSRHAGSTRARRASTYSSPARSTICANPWSLPAAMPSDQTPRMKDSTLLWPRAPEPITSRCPLATAPGTA